MLGLRGKQNWSPIMRKKDHSEGQTQKQFMVVEGMQGIIIEENLRSYCGRGVKPEEYSGLCRGEKQHVSKH